MLLLAALLAQAELPDGARVLFVGNTYFERDLRHNQLETDLVARWPERNLVFRNLGWDGDTVDCRSRGQFGSPQDGFRNLEKLVADFKPTHVFVAYGMVESFDGPGQLPAFTQGLERMLDMLQRSQARFVLLSPIRHEALGAPYPDPAEHNRSLEAYAKAIESVAKARGHGHVDLLRLEGAPLTDNGIHLNERGYRAAAREIQAALGLPLRNWSVDLDAAGKSLGAGTTISDVRVGADGARFRAHDATLPLGERTLKAAGLGAGTWALKVDGAEVARADAAGWARGVALAKGPEFDQRERLRAAIERKNAHFFHAWRPQNDTYIFGFRRKEQGHLAAEFPRFPAIVAEREAQIASLRSPVPHEYQLERVK
jgi:hypothetical protein